VEGDWPDCYRVNRCVQGLEGSGEGAREVLHAFARWPTWMWANEEVVALAEWMRAHNDGAGDVSLRSATAERRVVPFLALRTVLRQPGPRG
jgi:erythromycin esterase-like protein